MATAISPRRVINVPWTQRVLDSSGLANTEWIQYFQEWDRIRTYLLSQIQATPPEDVIIYDNGFSDTEFGTDVLIIDFGDSTSG